MIEGLPDSIALSFTVSCQPPTAISLAKPRDYVTSFLDKHTLKNEVYIFLNNALLLAL